MKEKSLSFVSSLNPLQKRTMHRMKCGACQCSNVRFNPKKNVSHNLNQHRHNARKPKSESFHHKWKCFFFYYSDTEIANKKAEISNAFQFITSIIVRFCSSLDLDSSIYISQHTKLFSIINSSIWMVIGVLLGG